MTEENENRPSDEETSEPTPEIKFEEQTYDVPEKGGKVCITYGRDQVMNRQVVSVIKQLGIEPVILQDKAHAEKPLAQFITENPNVAFLVAILSADDWAYPKNGKPNEAKLFADQKVVFHLGYWIGKLGRNRVFALYYDQQSFRWPTEHFELIYTPLDRNQLWKRELVDRLKKCNITFKPPESS